MGSGREATRHASARGARRGASHAPAGDATTRSTSTMLAAVVAALDAVDDHVVVLDERGQVLHANVAWQRFALDNGWEGARWIGLDYLSAGAVGVGDLQGGDDAATAGIRSVLEGRRERYDTEYDCHAPDELRWFRMRVRGVDVPGVGAVVTHTDVTHRRLAERALERRATRDELTGLANGASLRESAREMLRAGQVLGVLVVELTADGSPAVADAAVTAAAHLLEELFPAPAVTARDTHARLVVAAAGMTPEGVTLSQEIVHAALCDQLRDAHGVDVRVTVAHVRDEASADAALNAGTAGA